jgi:tetratricopeptide (TPR) repeat protein
MSLRRNPQTYASDHNTAALGDTPLERRNNAAVDMIYRGKTQEAIEELKKLEAEHPGEYATAANLGTAYELAGRNEDALQWINEAIRRDPDSHGGTEWLHVDILEAKIQAERDPAFFSSHSVLDLGYRQIHSIDSEIIAGGVRRPVKQIGRAILHQLQERLTFVKPTDPAVASLLYDCAAIEAATGTLESARDLLVMARDFGYPRARLDPLLKEYGEIITTAKVRRWIFYGAIVVTVLALIIYSRRRRASGVTAYVHSSAHDVL